jgi:hypothetical protein
MASDCGVAAGAKVIKTHVLSAIVLFRGVG